ncbi:MAG TPA: mechanosensitive ion channel domain-containing protein [Verrucomicrobiae bacterium]|nr:mechanosensitive ion channel domain-containing protein [Verrucomicrobiae bacterium]
MTWTEILGVFTKPLFQLGQTWISLATLVEFLVVTGIVLLLSRVVRHFLRTRVLARTKLDLGQQYAIARIVSYFVLVIGLLIGVETVGVNLSSLAVIAGALGVGIGFGLQNIVSNFVSGLIILAERPIQIGDRVDLGNDTVGKVVRIGARATHVLTNDNIMIIVPNSEFIAGRVVNWTHIDPRVRLRISVGASYTSDPHRVEKLLVEVAEGNPNVLKDPAPTVVFKAFGESALNFELRVWSGDMAHRPGTLESQLNFAIWDKFKENGIEIPFPQRDLHLKEPVRVELKSS